MIDFLRPFRPMSSADSTACPPSAELIAECYTSLLGRLVQPEELEVWLKRIDGGMSAAEVFRRIVGSPEASSYKEELFRERRMEFRPGAEDSRDFVISAYEAVLLRAPDAAEIEACLGALRDGLDATRFLRQLAMSEEAAAVNASRHHVPPDQAAHAADTLLSEEARRPVIAALYLGVLGRVADAAEIAEWTAHLSSGMSLQALVELLVGSNEARFLQTLAGVAWSPEQFVQLVGRIVADEDYSSVDIADRVGYMRSHGQTPVRYLVDHFGAAVRKLRADPAPAPKLDILSNLYMLGSNRTFNMGIWFDDERFVIGRRSRPRLSRSTRRSSPGTVTAIASLYKGDKYIKGFMENIVNQTIFDQSVTLVIIDAASPQSEFDVIQRYTETHKNIVYHRTDDRIGIYDAWNRAIKMSAGDYITNVNLDDLRREDSLEIQRDMLDDLEFADVVYQDFYYSLDSNISYDEIERRNIRCRLPHITLTNLIHFNSPHNGPMWRRKLHDELGYFNDAYRSAGDCDFWIRCCNAGKVFVKSNEPHVGYYVNPQGLSTHGETLGFTEHAKIKRHFGFGLVHDSLVEEGHRFAERVGVSPELVGDRARYDVVTDRLLALAQDTPE